MDTDCSNIYKAVAIRIGVKESNFVLSNGIKILHPGISLRQFVTCGNIEGGVKAHQKSLGHDDACLRKLGPFQ